MLILKNQLNQDGGLEKQTFSICQAFLEQKTKAAAKNKKPGTSGLEENQITIFAAKPKGRNANLLTIPSHLCKNIRLHLIGNPPLPHFLQLIYYNLQVKQYLKKHPFQLVLGLDKSTYQTHIRMGNGLHSFFLQQRKSYEPFWKKILMYLDPRHPTILFFEKKALLNPDLKKIIVNSKMVKEQILKAYPVAARKIKIVHNGVQWQQLQAVFDRSFLKKTYILKKLGLAENTHHFLFVGNGFKRKGLDLFLKALFLLKDKNWHLSIVGKDKNIKTYKKLAKKLKLQKKATFFGPQKNTFDFYAAADTFVLPTYYDPFANTTLEALAMGLFTITSQFNGGKEVITPDTGAILKNLHPQELGSWLKKALFMPKNYLFAEKIRQSVKHLEINQQTTKLLKELN